MTGAGQNDELTPLECRTLVVEEGGRVGITLRIAKHWDGLDAKIRGRFRRAMREWCEGRMLPREVYKTGGRYGKTPGGTTIAVFKSGQVRLYGFERHIDEIRTFVVVDCDLAKKQNRADQDVIDRLKVRVDAFGREKSK